MEEGTSLSSQEGYFCLPIPGLAVGWLSSGVNCIESKLAEESRCGTLPVAIQFIYLLSMLRRNPSDVVAQSYSQSSNAIRFIHSDPSEPPVIDANAPRATTHQIPPSITSSPHSTQLITVSPSLSLKLSLLPLPLLNPPGKLAPGGAFPNPGIG